MTDFLEIILTAIVTGMGMGAGVAVGTYFANKGLIRNIERIVEAVKNNKDK